jgi:hypothetical protein
VPAITGAQSYTYALPSSIYEQGTFTTTSSFGGASISASVNVFAGIRGSVSLGLGDVTPDYPVSIDPGALNSLPPPANPAGGGRSAEVDFRGQPRSNATHASTTDADARLYKKAAGQAAKLCHMGHVLTENRSGLVVQAELTQATGTAEREAATAMIGALEGNHRITVGADKAYDTLDFVAKMRDLGVTPHVAQNTKNRRSAIDGRTTRHAGYATSQRKRKRIEEVFGWVKSAAGLRKTRHRGTARVGWMFTLTAAAYNLVRLPKLLGAPG